MSLLEAIFILLIIAVITLSTVTYIRQARRQSQIAALLSEIQGVISAASDYSDAQDNFEGISAKDIAAMHTIVPRYNIVMVDQNELIDPWTGLSQSAQGANNVPPGITVASAAQNKNVQIRIEQLPAFACEQVLTQLSPLVTILDPDHLTPITSSIQDWCIAQNLAVRQAHAGALGASVVLQYPKSKDH